MRKPEILDFRDKLMGLTDEQYRPDWGPLAGTPVLSDDSEPVLETDRITGSVIGWYSAWFAHPDEFIREDSDGTLYFATEEEHDYALVMADGLNLYHERLLRVLLNQELTKEQLLILLGLFLIRTTEEDVWDDVKYFRRQGILP